MKIENLTQDIKEAPELYVLIGVPGSGKSTWTRKFLASSDKEFVVVSSDAALDRVAAEKGLKYPDVYKDYIGMATHEAKKNFRDAMESRSNIIFDQTNVSKKKRRGILQQMPKDYIKVAVVFQTDDKEVTRRLKSRAEETGKHIPDFVMKDMYGRWEEPTREEGFDRIIKV
jgi:tRNA uridine 5-carbamoylmethylation protein Kti12